MCDWGRDWTWDEMAKYDLPALLEYVTNSTGYAKVLYVGHRCATTAIACA